jgi:hypothetical protein
MDYRIKYDYIKVIKLKCASERIQIDNNGSGYKDYEVESVSHGLDICQ